MDELITKETRLLLDLELNRLPAKYRMPLVLCDLTGGTHEEAAQALGCPRKTITTRLLRAREHLRMRLVRRGLTLGSAKFAWMLSQESLTAAGSPLPDVALTARAAVQFLTTTAMSTGTVPASVAALSKGLLASMTFTRVKILGAGLLVVTLLGGSAGLFAFHTLTAGKDPPRSGPAG